MKRTDSGVPSHLNVMTPSCLRAVQCSPKLLAVPDWLLGPPLTHLRELGYSRSRDWADVLVSAFEEHA